MDGRAYLIEGTRYSHAAPGTGFALEIDSLGLGTGEVLALVGPNGAGKTTLLMMMAFLLRPERGRLEFFGKDPWIGEGQVFRARREAILVTHHPYLFKGTVFDNLAFGLKVRGIPATEWPARAAAGLEMVELAGWEKRPVSGLSAGQAQRVALARALALRPRVLLLDEPTANIEAGLALRIEAVIREVSTGPGTAVAFSTHNFSQASRLADDILYLSEGRQVEFSHENCFSGTAATDGRQSWVEPRPGLRIVFPGAVTGRVTCVIDPARIELSPAAELGRVSGPNVFSGRVSRMETIGPDAALVRVGGDLTFRATLPLAELGARGISLSSPVLIRFEPGSVELIGSQPAEYKHD